MHPVRKWQHVLISGWKHCFVQTRALCSKQVKSVVPSAKMTKRAKLAPETPFCKNSCTLLKLAKKWYTQCKNDKTCSSRAENDVFLQTRVLCWKPLKSSLRKAKITKRADLRIKRLSCTNSCTLPKLLKLVKTAKKCCAQCENDKTCWSCAGYAVLYKLVYFA